MTDSIKPPGSGPSPSVITPRAHTDATSPAPSVPVAATSGAAATAGPTAVLAEQLKAGALSPSQVIDAVIARAVDSARAQGLPAAEQDNLESVLRAALVNDPTLAGLRRELDR